MTFPVRNLCNRGSPFTRGELVPAVDRVMNTYLEKPRLPVMEAEYWSGSRGAMT
jgi:hypothetical protein